MNSVGHDIKYLFEPRTVALIGASTNPEKISYKILDNIISGGYKGNIFPVNPKGGKVCGLKIYKKIQDIGKDIDVAILAIPSPFVFESVKSCADSGVKFLTIITSGFSEVGNVEEEKKIVAYAREKGTRIIGPNIFGIYAAKKSLNATFGPRINHGNVAIVTQSGALGIAMIGKTAIDNIGLSIMVSVGNKADLDEADLLEYIIEDENSKIILFYIEGVQQGEKLVRALNQITNRKPVVVIKSGRSKRGAMAAASHTGSLAGSDAVFDDIMKQCGALRAESIQEALNWCKFLANTDIPKGQNAVIVTNGGGVGVLATDACEKYKIELFSDEKHLKNIFSDVTPDFGSTKNPIDLTGQAKLKDYNLALAAALKDKEIHSVLSLYCETAVFDSDSLTKMIETNHKNYKDQHKPLIFSVFGGKNTEESLNILKKRNVPVFGDIYETVSCMGALYSHYRHVNNQAKKPKDIPLDYDAINKITGKARDKQRYFLLPYEAQEIMEKIEINIPQSRIARNIEEAVRYAEEIHYPVVMKVISKDIIHKKDVGGVFLDLENEDEVMDAYQAIYHNCREYRPDAVVEGVEISEMVQIDTEIIIGARNDISFGPIVMFGLGGSYVEVLKEVSFRSFPLDKKEVVTMMKQTKAYPLLLGVRGEKKKDINSIVKTILKLGALITRCPDISDIEINPLVVYESGKGVKAVDVRILLSKPKGG